MTNSRLTDPEILETRFPVLLERFAIRRGSGGAGAHHGGDGVERHIRFLERDARGHPFQPPAGRRRAGLAGGDAAKPGVNQVSAPTARSRRSARPPRPIWRRATCS